MWHPYYSLHLSPPGSESGNFLLSYVDDAAIDVRWLVAQYTKWKDAFLTFSLRLEDSKTELLHVRAPGNPFLGGAKPLARLQART